MTMPRNLILKVLCIDKVVMEQEVKMVNFPGLEGRFEVLPFHADMVIAIKAGEVVIRPLDGPLSQLYVSAGIVNIHNNQCIVCVDDAVLEAEISRQVAELALLQAGQQIDSKKATCLEKDFLAVKREFYEQLLSLKP